MNAHAGPVRGIPACDTSGLAASARTLPCVGMRRSFSAFSLQGLKVKAGSPLQMVPQMDQARALALDGVSVWRPQVN